MFYEGKHYKINLETGCWEWVRSRNNSGYGQAYWKKKIASAHRTSWQIFNGDIPKNTWVLHKCDNKICVNPEHLWLGSRQDNVDDMCSKGRQYRGGSRRALFPK